MQPLFFSPLRRCCMSLLALMLVWTALILFTPPVYAYAGIPSAGLADDIDQPETPDAYPALKGMWCDWGATSCNPCAYDVEETFATLRTHGDLMGFNLGTHPDPHGIFTNHWQGIQRISTGDGKYLIVTRDSIDDAVGDDWSGFAVVYMGTQPGDGSRFHPNRLNVDYWNRYVKPNSADAIVATTLISKQYDHPGGIQTAGNILAVGTGNMIYFYDLTHRYTPERLTTVIHRPTRTGSSTFMTQVGRLFIASLFIAVGAPGTMSRSA